MTMNRKLKIVLMGTTDFAVPAMKQLAAAGHEIVCVVCQPDRPNQRGKKIKVLPVKAAALEMGLSVFQPERIKTPDAVAALKALDADLFVVAAYGQILSQEILDIPKMGCLNIHGSLLPKYRGAAPIHHAIIDGCTETGVTIMQLDAGMDTGDMLKKGCIPVTDDTTVGELYDAMAELGAVLMIETIDGLLDGTVVPEKQDPNEATYADKLDHETGRVIWTETSSRIMRRINGTTPFPGAYTLIGGEKMKCFSPEKVTDDSAHLPGTILFADRKNGLVIRTADGAVRLNEIQMPGKKRMAAKDYFLGNHLEIGTVLG